MLLSACDRTDTACLQNDLDEDKYPEGFNLSGTVPEATAATEAPESSITGNSWCCLVTTDDLAGRIPKLHTLCFRGIYKTLSHTCGCCHSGAQSKAADVDDDDDVVLITAPATKQTRAAAKPGVANAGKRQRPETELHDTDPKRKKVLPSSDDVISLE